MRGPKGPFPRCWVSLIQGLDRADRGGQESASFLAIVLSTELGALRAQSGVPIREPERF